jgi:hypothetical protein
MTLGELHNPLKHFSCARRPARWDVAFSICIYCFSREERLRRLLFNSDASLLCSEMGDFGFVLVDFFRSWSSWNSD